MSTIGIVGRNREGKLINGQIQCAETEPSVFLELFSTAMPPSEDANSLTATLDEDEIFENLDFNEPPNSSLFQKWYAKSIVLNTFQSFIKAYSLQVPNNDRDIAAANELIHIIEHNLREADEIALAYIVF
jgi:hypothetical protein